MWTWTTSSPEQTRRLGISIGKRLRGGDVIALLGPLGAGKTTLAQGIALGLGVSEDVYVNSPTYTIVREYDNDPRIHHYDFYRMEEPDELVETGYEDAVISDGVCLVEWFDNIPEAAPASYLRLEIEIDEDSRIIKAIPIGDRFEARFEESDMDRDKRR